MKTLMSRFQWIRSRQALSTALLAFGIARSSGEDVQSYRVPEEPQAAVPQHHSGSAVAPGEAVSEPPLRWTTPAGWEEWARGEMRLASFRVKGENRQTADVSVISLPGTAGGDLNNVNRWRG